MKNKKGAPTAATVQSAKTTFRIQFTPKLPKIQPPMSGLTLAQIERLIAQDDCVALPVVGDCMEAFGIDNGDHVAVCFTRFPRPPKYKRKDGYDRSDACLCWLNYQGRSFAGVKEYKGVWGPMQMVGTRYKCEDGKPFRMNWGAFASRIFGVAFACWDSAGRLKWQHDLNEYPEKLGSKPTIHGDNICDPIPMPTATIKVFEQEGRPAV